MKIAVIGANGQLGSDLVKYFSISNEVFALNHSQLEITDVNNVKEILSSIQPDVVINTSAYHNVPHCELNPEMSFNINGNGILNLSRVCTDIGARLVHYSTDYVFDGLKNNPYTEQDRCNPLNVYGITKLAGEHFALNYASKPYVIRISGIYGIVPCRAKGGNFITTMLRLSKEKAEVRVVNDEVLTPTPTSAIAQNTLELVKQEAYGLYHMTAEGECSWYEFAKAIWNELDIKTPLFPSSVRDSPLAVKRPFYSVLENNQLKKIGLNIMPHWKEGLINFLRDKNI